MKKGSVFVAVLCVAGFIWLLSSSRHSCDLCGSKDGVKYVTLYSESYYLCAKHYKEFITDKKPSSSSYSYSSGSNSYSSGSSGGYESSAPTQTTGQKNALRSAQQYLNAMGFSRKRLIEQLEYEGYSHDDAVYAVDNCGADWNTQAARSAKQYLSVMGFSRSGLIEQLEYEGFTHDQAVYGAQQNGY